MRTTFGPPATKILLSGFEPFGRHEVNSSWEAIRSFVDLSPGNVHIRPILLPVEYARGPALLEQKIDEYGPDVVISFGLAPGETVRLETVARNGHEGKSDNAGLVPATMLLDPEGEEIRPSSLPLGQIHGALEAVSIPAEYSTDAGGYVCNAVFYRLAAIGRARNIACGFVHLPPVGNTFPLPRLCDAVRCCIDGWLPMNPITPAG